jgi:nucleotide-binding universal stress UspA family protein
LVPPTDGPALGTFATRCSARALRWAADEAEAHGAKVAVVTTYTLPLPPAGAGYSAPHWSGDDASRHRDQLRENAEWLLEQTVSETLGDHPAIVIGTEVVEGSTVQVLLDASKDADLVVVGSRGHGGFAGMLLGSVSQHVIAHAACPVVVVR